MIILKNFFYLINNLFFPAIRIFFVLYTTHFFRNYLSLHLKVLLSFLFGFFVFSYYPISNFSISSLVGLIIFIEQIFIGIIIGLSINLIFSITNFIGEILGLQTGLSFFNFFDSTNRTNFPILTRFLNIFFIFIFLLIDGHLWIIYIVIKSFEIIPISLKSFNMHVFFFIVQIFGLIFISGLKIIFPFILVLFFINLTLCFLNKFLPQLSIFSIGFPTTAIMTILLLYFLIYYSISYLKIYFDKMFLLIIEIISKI
jgi:flagellar biosynthetic protein FliR